MQSYQEMSKEELLKREEEHLEAEYKSSNNEVELDNGEAIQEQLGMSMA